MSEEDVRQKYDNLLDAARAGRNKQLRAAARDIDQSTRTFLFALLWENAGTEKLIHLYPVFAALCNMAPKLREAQVTAQMYFANELSPGNATNDQLALILAFVTYVCQWRRRALDYIDRALSGSRPAPVRFLGFLAAARFRLRYRNGYMFIPDRESALRELSLLAARPECAELHQFALSVDDDYRAAQPASTPSELPSGLATLTVLPA